VSQGGEEWSEINHQDVLMCPQQHGEGDETSDIVTQTTELGHERWVPDHTPVIS